MAETRRRLTARQVTDEVFLHKDSDFEPPSDNDFSESSGDESANVDDVDAGRNRKTSQVLTILGGSDVEESTEGNGCCPNPMFAYIIIFVSRTETHGEWLIGNNFTNERSLEHVFPVLQTKTYREELL
ncbi:hypothetical protein BaRGS_00017218 [Batillaria attramentaria]|uniref:Uncharacterized protein n=1 Tax=Batillaria attramentaria TaxID=370345 RepID=A0ABD0KWH4_9CAEN